MITDETLDKAESLLGMAHSAWDMVNPKDVIRCCVEAVSGCSTDCVESCIKAVKALAIKQHMGHISTCQCNGCHDCNELLSHAIASLPPKGLYDGLDK